MTARAKKLLIRMAMAGLPLIAAGAAAAQEFHHEPPPKDVLRLDASVSSQVVPDLALVTMAVERSGTDVSAITADAMNVLNAAVKDAKAASGVSVSTGAFSTQPRYDNRGQRSGWTVRGELTIRGKDHGAIGKLAAQLSQNLQIAGMGFDISPELKAAEEEKLIERGLAAFQARAKTAAKALGFAGYTIRDVSLGTLAGAPRPPMPMMTARAAASAADAALPVEAGPTTLSLSVNGSVQLTH